MLQSFILDPVPSLLPIYWMHIHLLLVLNELDKRNLLLLLAEWRRRRRRLFWWCFKFKILHPFSQSSVSQSESVTVIQTDIYSSATTTQAARSFLRPPRLVLLHEPSTKAVRKAATTEDTKGYKSVLLSINFAHRVRSPGTNGWLSSLLLLSVYISWGAIKYLYAQNVFNHNLISYSYGE